MEHFGFNSIRTYRKEELQTRLDNIKAGKFSLFSEKEINEELERRNALELAKITHPDLTHA